MQEPFFSSTSCFAPFPADKIDVTAIGALLGPQRVCIKIARPVIIENFKG